MQLTLFKPLRIILSGSLLVLLGCKAPLNEKKLETPVMGWSSWNTYHVDINDSLIKRQADALVSLGLDKAGYRYVNIDDGYFGGRDADGNLKIHPIRFPKGLKPVVDHIHQLGLKAGIYSDAGRNTCGFYYDKDTIAHGVGMLGHDKTDAKFFFKDMDFDFIKIDFCGGNGLGGEPVLNEENRYREISEAIKTSGRKDVRMNVCRWDYPGTWVSDVASSWRISHDIRPRWQSVKDIIGQNLYLSAYAGNGSYNDMDMLEVGRGMTEDEDRTHFGIWCMMSSPLLIGKDLTDIDDKTLQLLSNPYLISINQNAAVGQAVVVKREGECYVLVKDSSLPQDPKRTVAFYNSGDSSEEMTLYFQDIDLHGKIRCFDVFSKEHMGEFTDVMKVTLKPHATSIYQLEADSRSIPVRYEAETAFISDYQELESPIHTFTGYYVEDDGCSGGAKAVNLGGSSENDLIWKRVIVDRKGKYTLVIKPASEAPSNVDICINGSDLGRVALNGLDPVTVVVPLKKGYNEVRLHNDKERISDIDYIDILPEDGMPYNLRVDGMTVEGRKDYVGCDLKNPRFGWSMISNAKNQKQTAYRILVSADRNLIENAIGDVWDSDKVESGQSQWIAYNGSDLKPDTKYYWRIKTWTDDAESPWSPVSTWTTGIMSSIGKDAVWIGLDTLGYDDCQTRHSRLSGRYLRKEFECPKSVEDATVHIAGLGFYELEINGVKVGDDVLTPAPTDFTKIVIYNSYDVTDMLHDRNAIGVTLAPGYYYAMAQNYQTNVRTTYGFPKMWMVLRLKYSDGTTEEIVSDKSWKISTDGGLRYSNIYDGEFFDATKSRSDWSRVGFDDDGWMPVQQVSAPGGDLKGNVTPAMHVYEVEKPRSIKRTGNGWIVDLGTNGAGQVRFKEKAVEGDTITIRHAELLYPGDTVLNTESYRSAEATDRYVSDGKGRILHPRFSWQGFRYAEISPAEAVDTATINRLLITDRMDMAQNHIEFETSDSILGKILENATRGILSNYKGMPVDCPQRDERMPWLGDRTTGALGESYVVDNHALYSKWMQDIRDCQRNDGAISDVAPAYWRLYNSNITWPAALPMVCDMLYRQYGDIKPMADSYAAIDKWLGFVKDKSMKDGLLSYDRYGDWCLPPESADIIHSSDSLRTTDGRLIASCYYYYLSNLMSEYGDLLGYVDKSDYYRREADEIRKRINDEFCREGKYLNSTVTASLLPLAMGIVEEDNRDFTLSQLIEAITEKGKSHISCGVIGIQWLMRFLSESGNPDLAWKLANNITYPSWGYMVKKGATTIWELWNGDTAPADMNSGNHVMLLGDLLPWCYENLGGIAPDRSKPGFQRIIMKPDFSISELSGVRASHKSPYGVIESDWKRRPDGITWNISIPVNCEAVIYFPDGSIEEIGSGDWNYVFQQSETVKH